MQPVERNCPYILVMVYGMWFRQVVFCCISKHLRKRAGSICSNVLFHRFKICLHQLNSGPAFELACFMMSDEYKDITIFTQS